jgi:hypothetical protein
MASAADDRSTGSPILGRLERAYGSGKHRRLFRDALERDRIAAVREAISLAHA